MISGATGSMAIVIVTLVSQHGVNYLFATVVLTGILQILVGIFKFGKYISVLPKSVMVGFVNGLAIIIFMAQLEQFKINVDGTTQWLAGTPFIIMGGLVILVMLITHYLPRFTKLLPSALVGIIVVTLIALATSFATTLTRVKTRLLLIAIIRLLLMMIIATW